MIRLSSLCVVAFWTLGVIACGETSTGDSADVPGEIGSTADADADGEVAADAEPDADSIADTASDADAVPDVDAGADAVPDTDADDVPDAALDVPDAVLDADDVPDAVLDVPDSVLDADADADAIGDAGPDAFPGRLALAPTLGGGVIADAIHRLRLTIGTPRPLGETSDDTHILRLGPQ
ncbi:MAG: hypothetical protein R3F39_04675 [Myxococcota bacterium]